MRGRSGENSTRIAGGRRVGIDSGRHGGKREGIGTEKNVRLNAGKMIGKGLWARKIVAYLLLITYLVTLLPMRAEAVNASQAGAVGIDVSKYQGTIDWNQVRNSGISFAILKVYSSYSGEDPSFAANVTGANAAGLRVGAYVYSYATTVEAAVAEANAAIAIMQKYTISFPVAIDIEDSVHKNLDPASLAAIANAFCTTIENAGYYPMVYSSKSWFTNRIGAISYDKWVAQYNSECTYEQTPCIWQASSTHRVNGIGTNVDLNYQYKDYSFILREGFSQRGENIYFYRNFRWQKGWIDYNGARYYCDDRGVRRSGWIRLGEGDFYYLDSAGVMQTGFTQVGDATYYLGEDGIRRTGLHKIGEEYYLFGGEGVMYKGWYRPEDGTVYHFAGDGHMLHNWYEEDGRRYFFDENGHMVRGFRKIEDKTYYFSVDGIMQTGWLYLNEGTFYMDETGARVTGWAQLGEKRYYFNPETGAMHRGWLNLEGNVYYLDPTTGAMLIGEQQLGESQYYFDPATGIRLTGLLQLGEKLCYFNPETGMKHLGWLTQEGKTRYFDPATGGMLIGLQKVGMNTYLFDANGYIYTGMYFDGLGNRYFYPEDGHMAVGLTKVKDVLYYFDPTNGYMLANMPVETPQGTYQLGADGSAVLIK